MSAALQAGQEKGCRKHIQEMQVSECFELISISRASKRPKPLPSLKVSALLTWFIKRKKWNRKKKINNVATQQQAFFVG